VAEWNAIADIPEGDHGGSGSNLQVPTVAWTLEQIARAQQALNLSVILAETNSSGNANSPKYTQVKKRPGYSEKYGKVDRGGFEPPTS
jgi:hypothetical protein